ncbi:MAG: preprotein translocase subunit SecE [Patescibacteria group bacterium]|nr:preprotein translocase subunit SecE [Patescibacteria group bacterium]
MINIGKIPTKINIFFKEIRIEIKKVNWPTKKETIRYTLITIAFSIAVAMYLGGIDLMFTALLNKFIL